MRGTGFGLPVSISNPNHGVPPNERSRDATTNDGRVALVHDYITQLGGAERVLLVLCEAFPGAPLYTSLYAPNRTYPEFQTRNIHTSFLDRVPQLRSHHRLALPLYPLAFRTLRVPGELAICSSSGWAHGINVDKKIVFCYTPARWLYQGKQYAQGSTAARLALNLLAPSLRRWDRKHAANAARYIAISEVVKQRILQTYGVEAIVVHPPPALDEQGPSEPQPGLSSGFFLCVARLLPYKNVDEICLAFKDFPQDHLVVVGDGPQLGRIRTLNVENVTLLPRVSDASLRWLYANCAAVVSASFEDYGLSPLEGAASGRPSIVLRWGGFLDTVVEDETGIFFDEPKAPIIADAIRTFKGRRWDPKIITQHVGNFSKARFIREIRNIVSETLRE